jgi:ParB-like chromosome segregation protein Spo0J
MTDHTEDLRPFLAAEAESHQCIIAAEVAEKEAQTNLLQLEVEAARVEQEAGAAVFAGGSSEKAAAHLATARAAVDVARQVVKAAQRNAKAAKATHMRNQAATYRKRAALLQAVAERQYAESKKFVDDLIARDGVAYVVVRHASPYEIEGWLFTAESMERSASRL